MSSDADFEKTLRATLEQSGLLQNMKSLFMEAALGVISGKEASLTDPRLLKPSPALAAAKDTESFAVSLTLVVDFLRHYGLLHTLNCLATEAGPDVLPPEALDGDAAAEHQGLCEELQLGSNSSPVNNSSALELFFLKKSAPTVTVSGGRAPAAAQEQAAAAQQPAASSPTRPATAAAAATSSSPVRSAETSPVKSAAASPDNNNSSNNSNRTNYPAGAKPSTALLKHPNGKANETPYTVEYFDGGEFVRYKKIAGQQFVMENMRNCRVLIFDAIDSLIMDDCENCDVVVAVCENAAFIRTSKNCNVTVACKQLRTRDSEDCNIYLFTPTDPIVESSVGMHFYPYNLASPNLIAAFKAARFDPKNNRFLHVFDFTKDDHSKDNGRAHFTVHWPDHGGLTMQRYGEATDFDAIDYPPEVEQLLKGEIGPAESLEKGAGKSLDIKTGSTKFSGGAATTTTAAAPAPAAKPAAAAAAAPKPAAKPPAAAPAAETTTDGADNNNKPKTAPTAPLPAAKDPYLLGRDSSSSSSDSYSSFEGSDDAF